MSKPGRPPRAVQVIEKPAVNVEQIEADANARQELATAVHQLTEQFGLAPYSRLHSIDRLRRLVDTGSRVMLETGALLVQMREAEPHGEWLDCLRAIGIEPRAAQKFMQAALKFSDPKLAKRIEPLRPGKLYELLTLDDSQIKELADGGSVAGITLDEIERMSCTELRKALREARADGEAKDRLIGDKDKRLNALEKRGYSPDAAVAAAVARRRDFAEQFGKACTDANEAYARMRTLLESDSLEDPADRLLQLDAVTTCAGLFRSTGIQHLRIATMLNVPAVPSIEKPE